MQDKLEAVNYLLDVLGSAPIGDLDTLHPDVDTCLNKLNDSSRFVQGAGYWYNREIGLTLTPHEDTKEIAIAPDTLKVLAIYDQFAVHRGTKLYDTNRHSYQFDNTITVDTVVFLEWELLPNSVQDAVKYMAAMQVCTIDLEDATKAADQEKLHNMAMAQVKAEEVELTRRNMLTTPGAMRHRSTRRPYGRGRTFNPNYPGGY